MIDSSLQVVMVEDIPRYHPFYEDAIRQAIPNAQVTFATDGVTALRLVREMPRVDLIILDLNIPQKHGSEVLMELRNDPGFDNVPIMILTGDSDKDAQSRLLEMGADDFIEKGAAPAIFTARLRAQIRHKLAFNQMTQMAMDMDIFTAGVLHDIRNIETSISALCDLIRMQMMEDPIGNRDRILDDIASLKGQANRISTYATNILQNLKQTSSQPKIESVPIARITEWVKGMISHRSDMNGSTLTIHLSQPLKPIAGDLHLLELVFLNLCQNSVRYARSGVPAEVTVYQRPSASEFRSGRPTAITCIRDNGIGIPKDDLRKVFLPFVRGDSSGGARPKGGFGLGLALVSKAVSMMGGRVWAELPEDGQPGTVICIELPEGEA